jgi:hypothetical protein
MGTRDHRHEENVMHPMFMDLFLNTDPEELLAEQENRRRTHRVKRNRSRMVRTAIVRKTRTGAPSP